VFQTIRAVIAEVERSLPQRRNLPDTLNARAHPFTVLRRRPHQLSEREPMVVGRADPPEGAKVNQSSATLLLPSAFSGAADAHIRSHIQVAR
jgi:hypothetical protein